MDLAASHAVEHHGLKPREYAYIGLILAIITAVELWVSYSSFSEAAMATILVILSAVKFAAVVAFFMHLRFEARLLTWMFVGPMALAGAVFLAVVSIFWADLPSLLQ